MTNSWHTATKVNMTNPLVMVTALGQLQDFTQKDYSDYWINLVPSGNPAG